MLIGVMRTFKKEVVGAVISSEDDRILMGTKAPGSAGVYADYWILPGGVVDDGDSPEETIYTEIVDETGLDLRGHPLNLIDDQGADVAPLTLTTGEVIAFDMTFSIYGFYIAQRHKEIDVVAGDELDRLKWAEIGDLTSYNLCPPSITLFKRLGYISSVGANALEARA